MSNEVIVVIGAGGIGTAIARRQSMGRKLLLADFNTDLLAKVAEDLRDAAYEVETMAVDVCSRDSVAAVAAKAAEMGSVTQMVDTAGLSPNMAEPRRILEVDLYGTAVVFEEFGKVIAPRGSALVISSMAGHMFPQLPPEQAHALAFTPTDELLSLPFLSPEAVDNSGIAYMISKRANYHRMQAVALEWGERNGARANAISPGIIATPLARHELASPIGDAYRFLISQSAVKRMASADEVAGLAAYLLGPDSTFVTGSDFLIDGGVMAAIMAGRVPTPS